MNSWIPMLFIYHLFDAHIVLDLATDHPFRLAPMAFFSRPHHSLIISFSFYSVRFSMLILYFHCPSPGINNVYWGALVPFIRGCI